MLKIFMTLMTLLPLFISTAGGASTSETPFEVLEFERLHATIADVYDKLFEHSLDQNSAGLLKILDDNPEPHLEAKEIETLEEFLVLPEMAARYDSYRQYYFDNPAEMMTKQGRVFTGYRELIKTMSPPKAFEVQNRYQRRSLVMYVLETLARANIEVGMISFLQSSVRKAGLDLEGEVSRLESWSKMTDGSLASAVRASERFLARMRRLEPKPALPPAPAAATTEQAQVPVGHLDNAALSLADLYDILWEINAPATAAGILELHRTNRQFLVDELGQKYLGTLIDSLLHPEGVEAYAKYRAHHDSNPTALYEKYKKIYLRYRESQSIAPAQKRGLILFQTVAVLRGGLTADHKLAARPSADFKGLDIAPGDAKNVYSRVITQFKSIQIGRDCAERFIQRMSPGRAKAASGIGDRMVDRLWELGPATLKAADLLTAIEQKQDWLAAEFSPEQLASLQALLQTPDGPAEYENYRRWCEDHPMEMYQKLRNDLLLTSGKISDQPELRRSYLLYKMISLLRAGVPLDPTKNLTQKQLERTDVTELEARRLCLHAIAFFKKWSKAVAMAERFNQRLPAQTSEPAPAPQPPPEPRPGEDIDQGPGDDRLLTFFLFDHLVEQRLSFDEAVSQGAEGLEPDLAEMWTTFSKRADAAEIYGRYFAFFNDNPAAYIAHLQDVARTYDPKKRVRGEHATRVRETRRAYLIYKMVVLLQAGIAMDSGTTQLQQSELNGLDISLDEAQRLLPTVKYHFGSRMDQAINVAKRLANRPSPEAGAEPAPTPEPPPESTVNADNDPASKVEEFEIHHPEIATLIERLWQAGIESPLQDLKAVLDDPLSLASVELTAGRARKLQAFLDQDTGDYEAYVQHYSRHPMAMLHKWSHLYESYRHGTYIGPDEARTVALYMLLVLHRADIPLNFNHLNTITAAELRTHRVALAARDVQGLAGLITGQLRVGLSEMIATARALVQRLPPVNDRSEEPGYLADQEIATEQAPAEAGPKPEPERLPVPSPSRAATTPTFAKRQMDFEAALQESLVTSQAPPPPAYEVLTDEDNTTVEDRIHRGYYDYQIYLLNLQQAMDPHHTGNLPPRTEQRRLAENLWGEIPAGNQWAITYYIISVLYKNGLDLTPNKTFLKSDVESLKSSVRPWDIVSCERRANLLRPNGFVTIVHDVIKQLPPPPPWVYHLTEQTNPELMSDGAWKRLVDQGALADELRAFLLARLRMLQKNDFNLHPQALKRRQSEIPFDVYDMMLDKASAAFDDHLHMYERFGIPRAVLAAGEQAVEEHCRQLLTAQPKN